MATLKQGLSNAFLNEERILHHVNQKINRRPKRSDSLAMAVSSIFLAVLLIGMQLSRPTDVVAGVVSVDLNPSVRFELTDEFIVLRALPQNTEAKTLEMQALIGLKITDAIALLIEQTVEQGYVDRLSLTRDYILVTTVARDGTNQTFSVDLKSLLLKLQKENPLLHGMSFAFMHALREDLEDADAQNTPFWRYLLEKENPNINLQETTDVQSYFEDPQLRRDFEASLGEVEDDETFEKEDLSEALDYLQKQGLDVSAYRTRLDQPDVSIEPLAKEIEVLLEQEDSEGEDVEENETDENESEEDEHEDENDEEDD